jgi:hypothetical protein
MAPETLLHFSATPPLTGMPLVRHCRRTLMVPLCLILLPCIGAGAIESPQSSPVRGSAPAELRTGAHEEETQVAANRKRRKRRPAKASAKRRKPSAKAGKASAKTGKKEQSSGKRSRSVPPRRCAGLVSGTIQCSRYVVEPTDYCARHAAQGRRKVPPNRAKI